MGDQRHAPAALPPEKRHGTQCIRSWVGPSAGLDGCGKSRLPTGIRYSDCLTRNKCLNRLRYPGRISSLTFVSIRTYKLAKHERYLLRTS